jgi:maleylacetoacetate isomerase
LSEEDRNAWYRHWLGEGMGMLEAQLANSAGTGRFCHGDMPTIADCCLVPQVFNARRFAVDLAPFPTIAAIDAACADIPAFQAAHPSRQPDAEG